MISRKGMTCGRPWSGSHSQTASSLVISDCSIPSARPAAAATPNDVNRATSATPSAGTMNSAYDDGSTVETGAISTPASPARTVAMIQLPSPMRFGRQADQRRADLVLGARAGGEPEPVRGDGDARQFNCLRGQDGRRGLRRGAEVQHRDA